MSERLQKGCKMSDWLFNIHMDGVVREVNASVLGSGLGLVGVTAGRNFEINPVLFEYVLH